LKSALARQKPHSTMKQGQGLENRKHEEGPQAESQGILLPRISAQVFFWGSGAEGINDETLIRLYSFDGSASYQCLKFGIRERRRYRVRVYRDSGGKIV